MAWFNDHLWTVPAGVVVEDDPATHPPAIVLGQGLHVEGDVPAQLHRLHPGDHGGDQAADVRRAQRHAGDRGHRALDVAGGVHELCDQK